MTPGKVIFSVFGGVVLFTFCILTGAGLLLSLGVATIPFWSVVWFSQPDRRRNINTRTHGEYAPPEYPHATADYAVPNCPFKDKQRIADYRQTLADQHRRKFAPGPEARAEIPMPTMSDREINAYGHELAAWALDKVARGQIDDPVRTLNDYARRAIDSGAWSNREQDNMQAIVDKAAQVWRDAADKARR